MTSSFGGPIFPINPKSPSILGIKAYKSIEELPDPVDLAVICTPAKTVPGIVRQCVKAKVRGAIIISAGFKEVGAEGVKLEEEILLEARRGQMRIIGPNCLGVMNPISGLNATFASAMARPGFKRWLTRWVPQPMERSTYVLATNLALALVGTHVVGCMRNDGGDLYLISWTQALAKEADSGSLAGEATGTEILPLTADVFVTALKGNIR